MSKSKDVKTGNVTQIEDKLDKSIVEVVTMMTNYEDMIAAVQQESENFRAESQTLKAKLDAIIAENNRLKNQPDQPSTVVQFRDDYIAVNENITNNLRQQLLAANKEKEMYENLWMKTGAVLEKQVQISSMSKVKEAEHSAEVAKLKGEIAAMKKYCEKESKINQTLQNHSKALQEEAAKIQSRNQTLAEKLQKVENENIELQQQVLDIEKCFAESNELNREQMKKVAELFRKLQESVQVGDEAMSEIDELMKEKKQMEEECQRLSETVGSVIDSASERIDKDFQELKANHEHEIGRLKQNIELEQEKTKFAHQKIQLLEEKLKNLDNINSFLGSDLETAVKTIVETEEKLILIKETTEENENLKNDRQQEIERLNKIIENNRKSKEKWKMLIVDVTEKLESKILALLKENYELRRALKKFTKNFK